MIGSTRRALTRAARPAAKKCVCLDQLSRFAGAVRGDSDSRSVQRKRGGERLRSRAEPLAWGNLPPKKVGNVEKQSHSWAQGDGEAKRELGPGISFEQSLAERPPLLGKSRLRRIAPEECGRRRARRAGNSLREIAAGRESSGRCFLNDGGSGPPPAADGASERELTRSPQRGIPRGLPRGPRTSGATRGPRRVLHGQSAPSVTTHQARRPRESSGAVERQLRRPVPAGENYPAERRASVSMTKGRGRTNSARATAGSTKWFTLVP